MVVSRSLIVALALLAGAGYLSYATASEPVVLREPLATFPMQLPGWVGSRAPDLSSDVARVLGVDEYVNRLYARSRERGVGLYIGYYKSQRQGDTIHSPLNCLPGAGWEPVSGGHIRIPVVTKAGVQASGIPNAESRTIEVNRYTIEKGLDRMVVLYWYQSHGRVVASEYWGKVYMVADAIRMNRTDAALVRVIAPVTDSGDPAAEQAAESLAVEFIKTTFPLLDLYLPA